MWILLVFVGYQQFPDWDAADPRVKPFAMNFESPSGCHYNTSTSKLLEAHEISWMSIRVYPYSWWMTSMLWSLWLCQDQHPMFHAVAELKHGRGMATGCEAMGSGIHGIVSCHALSCHSPREVLPASVSSVPSHIDNILRGFTRNFAIRGISVTLPPSNQNAFWASPVTPRN